MAAVRSTSSATSKSTRPAIKTSKRMSKKKNIVDPELRNQMIAEAAYFKALNRDFHGDYCVEDWLQAETDIDTLI